MLKWTASAQKLLQDTPSIRTPQTLSGRRRQRRATIANKENIPYTSTPLVAPRERNSPLVLGPLADIRNVTPEPMRRRRQTSSVRTPPNRRHSTAGFSKVAAAPQYASTLPRFAEEYSPSAALPSGQQLALRGLLPDPFVGNLRYFATPEVARRQGAESPKVLPPKRQLEQEFVQIAQECASGKTASVTASNVTALNSTRMGDRTLDKLIDAILDSARKDTSKKKKPRRSFNLRRRTLLKNQAEHNVDALILSPSYTAGDDPASDLSFLLVDAPPSRHINQMPPTPTPATPPPGTPIPDAVLQRLPTPRPTVPFLRSAARLDHTFKLETPVRHAAQKRRQPRSAQAAGDAHVVAASGGTKRFRVDGRSYFEIGLALPSIYV